MAKEHELRVEHGVQVHLIVVTQVVVQLFDVIGLPDLLRRDLGLVADESGVVLVMELVARVHLLVRLELDELG